MGKAIGIIGGMGPMATCDLMRKIIHLTDAHTDQAHVHMMVDCNTNIPDRTGAIVDGLESPVPEMCRSAIGLQEMGAQALVIACNTAHYFLKEIQNSVDIPILSMPHETARYLLDQGFHSVAVLGTYGTIRSGVYGDTLAGMDIACVYPNASDQRFIMSLIYDYVKAGKDYPHPEKVQTMVNRLKEKGVQALVLGCTELPILFANLEVSLPVIDPTNVLARSVIRFAGSKLKQKHRTG